jgi:hypothetical protein
MHRQCLPEVCYPSNLWLFAGDSRYEAGPNSSKFFEKEFLIRLVFTGSLASRIRPFRPVLITTSRRDDQVHPPATSARWQTNAGERL